MSLNEQIYDFFNEARPRTKSAGVEDIERRPVGQGKSKGDRPRPYNAKEKLKKVQLPQEGRSLFKEGYVHEISFIPAEPKVISPRKNPEEKKAASSQIDRSAQKSIYYTIFRKITQEEFNKIRKSPYSNTIYPTIDEPEHFKDLYYVNFPLPLYGSRVHSATDLEVSIDLVPLSDIYEKGVGVRNLSPMELNTYVTEVPKIRYPFSLEDISFKYASNLTLDQANNVKNYVNSFKPNDKVEKIDRKKSKEIIQSPERLAAIAATRFFSYSIGGGRMDGEELLKRVLRSHGDLMNTSLQNTYDYYQPKRLSSQGEQLKSKTIELKETDPIIQSFLKDRKEKNLPPLELDKEYPIENKKGFTVTLTNDDKTKARKKRAEDIKNFLSLMDSFIETFTDSKEKNVIRKSLIEDPENILQRRLTASDSANLYNIIKKAYEDMKTKELKETTITEAEGPSKKYAIELKAGSEADKLYSSKNVPKVFGRKNTYIRSLNPDQVKSVNRSVDVVSVEELPKDVKGFIKPSSSFRDKEKGDVVRFDPKNPKDIENLTGKLKPGEKLYSVNIKMGDAKSQDVMMPLSQIEKLVPDLKFGKDIKQPFEKDMFRAISKDTGEKVYDKVKGVLSFNSVDPIGKKDGNVDKNITPVKYLVVNILDKKLVKGFATQEEAEKYSKEIGGYPNIAINRSDLSKYKIDLKSRKTEELSPEDKKSMVGKSLSFSIEDLVTKKDQPQQYNIKDTVKDYSIKDGKLIINFSIGKLELDKEGNGIFSSLQDIKQGDEIIANAGEGKAVLNMPQDLKGLAKKALEPKADKQEPKLEAYIRQRIRQAIKEAEVSQYWGYQGKDVKKKRLEEYLKRYEWGFQDSENPYTHSNGSAIHAIVSKLVHELAAMGVDAIAIFNSYAPEGYQVSDLDQLDYASDSPLGSQLTQPYNPDSLTARGGRVAEMNGPVPYKGQGADQLDRLVKDMSPKLKDAVKAKANAKQAKDVLSVFRQVYKMSDDVTDDEIYNKIKSA